MASVSISRHARQRIAERLNADALAPEIAAMLARAWLMGAIGVKYRGMRYVVKNGTLVTVCPIAPKRKHARYARKNAVDLDD